MGGSRSDDTVELSYDYGFRQRPQVNEAQGVELAASTCAGWGYSASQPFGGMLSRCEESDSRGNCVRFLVTRKYQCLGAPGSSITTQREPVALSPVQSAPTQPQTTSRPARAAVPAANPQVGDQWDPSDNPQ